MLKSLATLHTVLFLVLTLLVSCSKVVTEKQSGVNDTKIERKNRTLFLNFSIALQDEDSSYVVQLDTAIVKNVKIKSVPAHHPANDLLEYRLLDEHGNELYINYLENPLSKSVEVVNEQGHFERIKVTAKKGEFSLRTTVTPEVTYVEINRFKVDRKSKNLIKIDISREVGNE